MSASPDQLLKVFQVGWQKMLLRASLKAAEFSTLTGAIISALFTLSHPQSRGIHDQVLHNLSIVRVRFHEAIASMLSVLPLVGLY